MTEFRREMTIAPAYDKRSPDPSKDYGIHGCNLRFVLTGPEGAVQFVLYTNWQLPHVTEELIARVQDEIGIRAFFLPLPADLGYHSPKPLYEGQTSMGACPYLDGKDCYYDGSGLDAERVYNKMLEGGSDAVWAELEDYYQSTFGTDQEKELEANNL